MGIPVKFGWVIFVAVPVLLWLIGTAFVRRGGLDARALAFVAGSDNRLSLSRLQAFLWTLVIFGSYAAAMAVHRPIISGLAREAEHARAEAGTARAEADTARATAQRMAGEAATAARALEAAVRDTVAKQARVRARAGTGDNAQLASDSAQLREAMAILREKTALREHAEAAARDARAKVGPAELETNRAEVKAAGYTWIKIPAELLSLAGIAIGAGVFSSLISIVGSEGKIACATKLTFDSHAGFLTATDAAGAPKYPDLRPTSAKMCLLIDGRNLGADGRVRFGTHNYLDVLFWKTDGTAIIVALPEAMVETAGLKPPTGRASPVLVVDTPNGKLAYELALPAQVVPPGSDLRFGEAKLYYEFADLFRDDKNPSGLDLMKFQMFGWTLIAIVIYVWIFLRNLTPDLTTLPAVDSSVVILTGLSQAGYLTSKGVSNAKST